MRVIHKASLVFLLKDIYYKAPIVTASILCNGKQNPYTRKRDGYYVFSDLYPMDYDISISCKGYTDINFSVKLKENETKVMTFDMPYTADNSNLTRLTRFELTLYNGKKKILNHDVSFKLKNNISFIKLIEPISAGNEEMKLNLEEFTSGIIGQKYIYKIGKKKQEIEISGYDSDKKCYTLKEPLSEDLREGGRFYPIWNLKTDGAGRLIMPLISQFMKDDILEFQLEVKDFEGKNLKGNVSVEVGNEQQSGKVFYSDAKLRKVVEKKTIHTEEK